VHVSRIDITGFKSFADRTAIDLEPGITAVVGPNGCGKTNICDAIRWVLGEENVRLLRGNRIEDVIFAGTELRKPTGMAEVSMTLSDVQDVLPVEYNEVTVTRRVFRSGESQFYINKTPSRLKDIVNLFLGTGMGRRAYSVMEREMIDWILEDTGGHRRRIIEEAAGISKYKVRRKETLNKLELTQRDLDRAEDLISEVERRVRSLARQAARARRYDRLNNRIKEVETQAAVAQFASMQDERKRLAGELERIETDLAAAGRDASVAESEIENIRLDILEVDKEINAAGEEAAAVTGDIQKAENEKVILGERKRSLDEKSRETAGAAQEKRGLIEEKRELLDRRSKEARADREKHRELLAGLQELEAEYTDAERELRSKRERSVTSAREQIESMKRTVDVASVVSEVKARRAHLTESIERTRKRCAELEGRIAEVGAGIGESEEMLGRLRPELAESTRELEKLESLVEELGVKLEAIREERARLGEEAARTGSRHDLLKDLVESYEGYESGVKAIMEVGKAEEGVHGVVGDVIKCSDPRYEPGVVAALSDAVQYVIVEGKDRAVSSIRMLKEEKKGAATLVLLDKVPSSGGEGSPSPEGLGVMGNVMDFVDCDPRYGELLGHLLRDSFMVESLDHAFALSERAGYGRMRFVTPDGDSVYRGNIVRSGGDGGRGGVFLGRQEKVADLADEAESLKRLAEEQDAAFRELSAGLGDLKGQKAEKIKAHEELAGRLGEEERSLQGRIAERDSLRGSLGSLKADIEELEGALSEVEKQMAESGIRVEDLDLDQHGLFEGIEHDDELEARVDDLGRRLDEGRRQALRLDANRNFARETIARIEKEISALETEVAELERTGGELRGKRQELEAGEEAISGRMGELMRKLDTVRARRREEVEKKRGLEIEIETRRKRIKETGTRKEELLERKQELQNEDNLLGVRAQALRERIGEDYGVDIAEAAPPDGEPEEGAAEELADLKEKLQRLGPVNLVALEEYDLEKERLDFLKGQRDDLLKARESLDEAILQINRRAKTEFTDTFSQVRRDFRKNFSMLFDGGDSDLRLRYEADPLESPVDIFAQPSGKKLEHISLLSGGERALTAIAFIFAVYYTRPSPFCLLDEVDAPLDDANVGRFINLLRYFAERTQFMMVTHNKKTMEAASVLYGVTMEEPGVSRMVSVRLDRDTGEVKDPSLVG
jgi:chromosome segregation protein